MDALRAHAALEYILDRTGSEDLRYWSTPGCFALETSDTPECQEEDYYAEPAWERHTLHELLWEVAADLAQAQDEEEQ